MGSCAAPSAKGDDKFITTDYLQQCRIDQCLDLSDLRAYLADFYSPIGRPSIDPELMVRMLVVGYLLWHSFRAAIVRRGAPEPGLSLVLPVGSGRRSPQSLDLLEESPWAFS